MLKSIKPATLSVAATALFAAAALSIPYASALAQTDTPEAAAATPHKSHTRHAEAKSPKERAEAFIDDLKTKLQITDAQQQQWDAVAAVIRDNAKETEDRYDARRTAAATQNAVEDLKNYADMTEAHAQGVKRLEAAFETLYTSLSDDQKKNADLVFARHEGRGEHHRAGKKQA